MLRCTTHLFIGLWLSSSVASGADSTAQTSTASLTVTPQQETVRPNAITPIRIPLDLIRPTPRRPEKRPKTRKKVEPRGVRTLPPMPSHGRPSPATTTTVRPVRRVARKYVVPLQNPSTLAKQAIREISAGRTSNAAGIVSTIDSQIQHSPESRSRMYRSLERFQGPARLEFERLLKQQRNPQPAVTWTGY